MHYNIALVCGDGIGPEIVDAAVSVLDTIASIYKLELRYTDICAGGVSIDRYGVPLLNEELQKCKESDAVLLGAVGGPKWDNLPGDIRPEKALLGIRKGLELYANLRPAQLFEPLKEACPLKEEIIGNGLDILIVRELTGDVYFGSHERRGDTAYDEMRYSGSEIERIGRVAFQSAMGRSKKLISVDKANILESSRLWRETMHRLHEEFPEVIYSDMLVDNCAMQLIRDPQQFDVIVTGNMFGDILSDEASMITGSIGMLPSASIGDGTRGMYEPIHGSAPDIAGTGRANPIATILSVALMFRYSLACEEAATRIEYAVMQVLRHGCRTADIAKKGETVLSTAQMRDAIISAILE